MSRSKRIGLAVLDEVAQALGFVFLACAVFIWIEDDFEKYSMPAQVVTSLTFFFLSIIATFVREWAHRKRGFREIRVEPS